ncbi:trypsin beta-like [Pararge aegeria]|uniref:trypsin beta-like n=1 Tax=Pararge aegeria TaxID=116150 RepID=UPI0019CFE64E|nr:trypsin beta-like [Pararge aegeria]
MCNAVFRIAIVMIVVFERGIQESMKAQTVVEVDYSELVGEAEMHKNNILKFLNETRVLQHYKLLFKNLLNKLLENTKSGRRGSTRRIVSGVNTSIAAVPWQVSLREKTYPICGGSVITALWLLTAAHCLLRPKASELSVRLGSSWKTHGGEMYDVKESYVHPKYVRITKVNDVGLVKLYSPLRFSARILPISIVAREERLPANQAAIVSGWGKLREGGPSATFLQSSTIKTIAMKLCLNSGLDRNPIDPASMFCAGSFIQPSPDACQGDSGGPIVSEGVLIGVVSWGLGCARGNFPGVYSRLAQPLIWDWVHAHVTRNIDNNVTQ